MFLTDTLDTLELKQEKMLFDELSTNIQFENISIGRQCAVLIEKDKYKNIVRTTSNYNFQVQYFSQIHYDIINCIQKKIPFDIKFNNAMIEIYDNTYTKMKFHTDQSLDLNNDSYICIFSCYQYPTKFPRKLIIKKKSQENQQEILLLNNSFILFDTFTNKNHLHKIILDNNKENNKWLGITFRLSKTFIKFINEIPYNIINNKQLTLANEIEKKEFYKHKSLENLNTSYNYSEINYTISNQDLLP